MILEQTEIKYKGKVIFERLVMSTNFKRVPKLFTEDEACFLYLTKGAFHYRTPTSVLAFNEGDGMLAKCGNYFIENVMINEKTEHQVISAIGAFFYPAMVKDFFQADLSVSQLHRNFDTLRISIEPLMKSFIDSINFMFDNPEVADENLTVTKLKELLLLLNNSEKGNSIRSFVDSLFVVHEYNFTEVIQKNLYTNLSLSELAYLCSMSLATFKRRFTDIYKESPARYLMKRKLEQAVRLLGYKSKPVSEIAYECGFETVSNFDKAFKKMYGQSPTEYRMSRNDK